MKNKKSNFGRILSVEIFFPTKASTYLVGENCKDIFFVSDDITIVQVIFKNGEEKHFFGIPFSMHFEGQKNKE